ncbi:hypothetical protein CEXT_218561 [Caerostris extrusa]|uniref:Uncharacterized protein n=1 Tax=Caerostris extrusa TaxID=172846 RepID=A0AAV4TD20_CAEEX|nr:hypothetical protein CEXT_218561 [Caerostris extrusa]
MRRGRVSISQLRFGFKLEGQNVGPSSVVNLTPLYDYHTCNDLSRLKASRHIAAAQILVNLGTLSLDLCLQDHVLLDPQYMCSPSLNWVEFGLQKRWTYHISPDSPNIGVIEKIWDLLERSDTERKKKDINRFGENIGQTLKNIIETCLERIIKRLEIGPFCKITEKTKLDMKVILFHINRMPKKFIVVIRGPWLCNPILTNKGKIPHFYVRGCYDFYKASGYQHLKGPVSLAHSFHVFPSFGNERNE